MPNMKQYLVSAETSKVNIEALIQLFGFLAKKEKLVFKQQMEKKNNEPKEKEVESSLKSLLGIEPQVSTETKEETKKEEVTSPEIDFDGFKKQYQLNKLLKKDVSELTTEFYETMCHNYLEGLFWTLSYYYQGHLSWKWYYGYHVAPFVTDLFSANNFKLKFDFEMGKPFTPLQQLLAVLPPHSKSLVPSIYQSLMVDPASPIIEFFPNEFEFLLDEKSREWRNIALIPFLDETKLVEAFNKIEESGLNPQEKRRNAFGPPILFSWTKDKVSTQFKSKLWKDEKVENHCKFEGLVLEDTTKPKVFFKPVLANGFEKSFTLSQGFPTLHTLPFQTYLEKIGVNVVGGQSRAESRVIKIHYSPRDLSEIAGHWIGHRCFVDYPYHTEAEISHFSTENVQYTLSNRNKLVISEVPPAGLSWKDLVSQLESTYKTFYGITFSNPITCVVYVRLFEGMRRTRGSGTHKKFASALVAVPLPLVVLQESVITKLQSNERFQETLAKISVEEEFAPGSKIAYLGLQYYGSTGTVVGFNKRDDSLLDVDIEVYPSDPQFAHAVLATVKEKYYKGGEIAKILDVNALTVARITGTINFKPDDVDLGIGIKYTSRDLCVPGYAKKVTYKVDKNVKTAFEYSERALKLLKDYKDAFPALFEGVNKDPKQDSFDAAQIFGEKYKEKLVEILKWLSESAAAKLALVPCDSLSLPAESIAEIEKQAIVHVEVANKKKARKTVSVTPGELINPSYPIEFGHVHSSKFELGDRVVHAGNTGPVPFGMRGTVVTLHQDMAEVLFDEEFLSGTNLHNRCNSLRGGTVSVSSLVNLTHTHAVIASTRKDASAPKAKPTKTFNPFDMLDDQ